MTPFVAMSVFRPRMTIQGYLSDVGRAVGHFLAFMAGRALGSVEEHRHRSVSLLIRVLALSAALVGLGLILWSIPATGFRAKTQSCCT